MVTDNVLERVDEALSLVERERAVRVLYACESGSRAWGFESQDSDYDVRFLYVHPRDWYLAVDERRDVVEMPIFDDLDVSGLEISDDDLSELLAVDTQGWRSAVPQIRSHYEKFGDTLPEELLKALGQLESNLAKATA